MQFAQVKISPKFQIVIPKLFREKFNLKAGKTMVLIEKANHIHLIPIGDIKGARGMIGKTTTHDVRDRHERIN